MKKTLVLLAVILITATLFAACTKQPAETSAAAETTTVLQEVETTENSTAKIEETVPEVTEPVNKQTENVQKNQPPKNDNTPKTDAVSIDNIITKEEAKSIVLNHAGFKETEVKRLRVELDKERNYLVYEVDFDADKYEYEYEVNAESGKVIKAEKEFRD